MDRDEVSAVHGMIDDVLSKSLPISMGKPNWVYRDLPRMLPALMDEFKMVVGDENLQWVTWADYGRTVRGQVLISPDGMKRLNDYIASTKQ
jgi:hypothetical protein